MSYPPPYGQQPQGGQPPYGQEPYGQPQGGPPYAGPPQEQPYGVQPQYVQQPYGAQPPPPSGPPMPPPMTEPPQTMVWARWAMWLGAALTMLYTPAGVLDVLVIDRSEWDQVATEISDSGATTIVILFAVFGFLLSALFAALWVLIARACTRGQEWARITAPILWVLWFFTYLCGFIDLAVGVVLIVNTLIVLTGVAAVLFLFLPDSSAWFRQHRTPRYYA